MDSRQVVLAKYPQAASTFHRGDVDADLAYNRYSHWCVCEGASVATRTIGVSMSEDGAWHDAAATVRAEWAPKASD